MIAPRTATIGAPSTFTTPHAHASTSAAQPFDEAGHERGRVDVERHARVVLGHPSGRPRAAPDPAEVGHGLAARPRAVRLDLDAGRLQASRATGRSRSPARAGRASTRPRSTRTARRTRCRTARLPAGTRASGESGAGAHIAFTPSRSSFTRSVTSSPTHTGSLASVDAGEPAEHGLRGLRVDPDVRLGGRRDVALVIERAAHDGEPLAGAPGARGSSDSASATFVSGPVATSSTSPGRSRAVSTKQPRGVALGRRARRGRQLRVAQPALAVHDRERQVLADERPARALRDLHVGVPAELEHRERVLGRLLDVDVAHHRRRADQRHLGRGERVQDRQRVVDAGVDVEDQRDGFHGCTG